MASNYNELNKDTEKYKELCNKDLEIIAHSFYRTDVREKVIENGDCFVLEEADCFIKTLEFYHDELSKGNFPTFPTYKHIADKAFEFGSEVDESVIIDICSKANTALTYDAKTLDKLLKANKIKVELRKKEISPFSNFEKASKNLYVDDFDDLLDNYRSMGKIIEKYTGHIEVLAKPLDPSIYEKEINNRILQKFRTFGFKEIDRHTTYGASPGKITVTAGRPSQGKSVLTNLMSWKVAQSGIVQDYEDVNYRERPFSALYLCEMDTNSWIDRVVAANTNVPITYFTQEMQGDPHNIKEKILKNCRGMTKNKYFYISDKANISYSNLIDDLKRLQDIIGQEYIYATVDLFSKLSDFFKDKDKSTMVAEEIGARLQNDVKRMGIHMNLVIQLNRTGAYDKKIRTVDDLNNYMPKLESIKNAGMYEEIADLVMMVMRPKKIAIENECDFVDEIEDTLDVVFPKQRGGATGVKIKLGFDQHTTNLFSIENLQDDKLDLSPEDVQNLIMSQTI